ncbi:bifunctional enzyme CysN/CysC [Paramaledivibacter caminithermalis DSM 15212]|jgi:bifunctional enzyme CysN/CysC|uniref:sulfate adenylyltransferase n=2 Tax=Paramaledivibacter TaxID=1884934 RepID=A0A1M6JUH7_PARC5|nr:bifunctional enzyme CysN/CysC [Paramaledivibacter caminithermalis DSM 15212]
MTSNIKTDKELTIDNCQLSIKEDMNIVIVGHVDHGKSTIIGRLLADTGSLPKGKLEHVKETCRKNSKPFEYAFLLDALKEEQAQGITIDIARCFFKTKKRNYIILDSPGHIEFLKNMITGASRAEAALLVIDASEGIRENSRRHGYMLSMLGIKQVTVLINKMDLINYDLDVYKKVAYNFSKFLKKIDMNVTSFIPVSGLKGDNIAFSSKNMDWYKGKTVLEMLDNFKTGRKLTDKPFRMPVQGVYKFTKDGDTRRIIAGTVMSGKLKVGDEVIFYPSGKKSKVKSIEAFNKDKQIMSEAGSATGFTLEEQIYITRGEVASILNEQKPRITSRIRTNIFWLGKEPMIKNKKYYFKLGTAKVSVKLEKIISVMNSSTLEHKNKEKIEKYEVAECILKLDRAIAFDLTQDIVQMSRFVLVDDYKISGGGIICEDLEDKETWVRDKVLIRDNKWEKSWISPMERAEIYNQTPALILITGTKKEDKKSIAKALEKKLVKDGKIAYFLGIGNLLYGVDADKRNEIENNKVESLRKLAEVAKIILDAGLILIVTATELSQADLNIIKTAISSENIETIWIGERVTTDIKYNLLIPSTYKLEGAAAKIKVLLQDKGIIFKPW